MLIALRAFEKINSLYELEISDDSREEKSLKKGFERYFQIRARAREAGFRCRRHVDKVRYLK